MFSKPPAAGKRDARTEGTGRSAKPTTAPIDCDALTSAPGPFETCRQSPGMSACWGRLEAVGVRSKWRDWPISRAWAWPDIGPTIALYEHSVSPSRGTLATLSPCDT